MPGMKQRVKDGLSLFLLRHSRFFDASFYRKQAGIPETEDAAKHYHSGGWRGADPSPYFPQENYLAMRRDVREAGVCPLAHWLLYGKEDFPGLNSNRYYRRPVTRAIRRAAGRTAHRKTIRRNRGARILAAAYLPDARAAGEIFEYLKNLRPYDWDLAVTVPEGTETESLEKQAKALCSGAEIRACENRGKDIAPWLETIRSRDLNAYDIVMKIHPADGRDRFVSAMEAVCGAGAVHGNIDRLMNGETDLVPSGIRRDPPFRETLVNRELKRYCLALPAGYSYDEAGIFAMRAETAAEPAKTGIRTEDFEPSNRPAAPLTRAMGRYITGSAFAGAEPAAAAGPAAGGRVIAFAVSETGSDAVAGDYFTALELAGALEKQGWQARMLARNEGNWYEAGNDTDVLVSMLEDYDPGQIRDSKPGLLTIAWARNWFEKWAVSPGLGDYGILLASSGAACRELEEKTGLPVRCFPIAANAERFREANGEADPAFRCDVCFTGNRFSPREIEKALVPANLPYEIRIYGDGWDASESFRPYCKGHLPYDEIPKVYRGAKIALDDATASTRETGAVNSRVFDALAAGCLVLTNNEAGARETFEGKLPVFRNREELEALLKQYLEDEAARQDKVAELRRFVLERHTYGIRAKELTELIREWRAGN